MPVNPFINRIARVQRALNAAKPAALFISSAPAQIRNRDITYPDRQESVLFSLHGIPEPGFALLMSTELKQPLLFGPPSDPVHRLWEGERSSAAKLARRIGAEPITTNEIRAEAKKRLKG